MSTSSEVLGDSYLDELLSRYSDYSPSDFWSLICCGTDLHHPYEGWAGVVACPIFDPEIRQYELFFGEFTESLAQYENLMRCRINEDISKIQAFSEFRSYIESVSDHPVFISANAHTWALRIVNDAVAADASGPWNAQLICLRDLFSTVRNHGKISRSQFIGSAFGMAPSLPKRFGLHAIANELNISVPESSDKATHRAALTAAVAKHCLEQTYPSSE